MVLIPGHEDRARKLFTELIFVISSVVEVDVRHSASYVLKVPRAMAIGVFVAFNEGLEPIRDQVTGVETVEEFLARRKF